MSKLKSSSSEQDSIKDSKRESDVQKGVKSKAPHSSSAVKSVSKLNTTEGKVESSLAQQLAVLSDKVGEVLLGKYFKPVLRFLSPQRTREFETIGKVVSAIIDNDDSFIFKSKLSKDIDLSHPDWWKSLAGNILTSKMNKGGNKDAKE